MMGMEYEFHKGGFLGIDYNGRHVMLQARAPSLRLRHIISRTATTQLPLNPCTLLAKPLPLHTHTITHLSQTSHSPLTHPSRPSNTSHRSPIARPSLSLHTRAQVSTFGVSPQLVRSRMQTESSSDTLAHVQSALAAASVAGTRPLVAAGVDYLDRLKGVSLKLLAWEALLTNYPKFQKGYVLVQVCLGMRNQNGLSSSPEIRAEIESIAKRINEHFPGSVCLEVVEDISCAERLQLWQLADVFVSTAIREAGACSRPRAHTYLPRCMNHRDGSSRVCDSESSSYMWSCRRLAVNIWPLEYVFCRGHAKLPAGSLVLSEFTGSPSPLAPLPEIATPLTATTRTLLQQPSHRAPRTYNETRV